MLTSDELMAVVRVHADRVHDAVRRLGCSPEASVRVVQQSALELVDAVARRTEDVSDPVGWWFARARSLARRDGGVDEALPLGGGLLSSDANQVRLAEALESRPERERAALLMRDSYDLPMSSVATVVALDPSGAAELVGQARLALLPALTETAAPPRPDHAASLGSLGRVAEGGAAAARETTTRRHVQTCSACAALVDAQDRVRRLLAGLTVVALPDAAREMLLSRVADRAAAALPAAAPVADAEWLEEPQRGYSLSLMALGLVLAVAAGAGLGALASRGAPVRALTDDHHVPYVTAAPVLAVGPTAAPSATPTPPTSPPPRVFLVTPSPTPPPTASPTAVPSASNPTQTTTLVLDPTSGPANTQITVTGQGWRPGSQVIVAFHNSFGGQVGATAQAVVDPAGSFTTTLAAHDTGQNPLPGPHTVTADDGAEHAQATFTVTG